MKIPLFPLDLVLFPGVALPLHIFEDRYRLMTAECLDSSSVFGVVRAQREGLSVIGCTARIVRVLERYSDGRLDILCEGMDRFEIEMLDESRPFLQAEVDPLDDIGPEADRDERALAAGLHFEAMELLQPDPEYPALDLDRAISFRLAAALPSEPGFKQLLLAMRSDRQRTSCLIDFYNAVLPKLRTGLQTNRTASRNGHVM